MDNRVNRIVIFTIVITLLTGAIWWFGYRPYAIRKDCAQKAAKAVSELDEPISSYPVAFQVCLNRSGL